MLGKRLTFAEVTGKEGPVRFTKPGAESRGRKGPLIRLSPFHAKSIPVAGWRLPHLAVSSQNLSA